MELQKALKEVREQKIAPVYLLIGTELYLSELFKTTLMKELLTEEDDQFNFFSFDMEETPLSAAIAEAETIPFFGDYRLVFVENPYFLTAERKTNGVEHDVNLLLNYLESPSPTTVLVFMASYEKLDERKKITKALKKMPQWLTSIQWMKRLFVSTFLKRLRAKGTLFVPMLLIYYFN